MLRFTCLFLALFGAVLSAWLLGVHVEHGVANKEGAAMPMPLCGSGGNCDKVLESRWAWFPPLPVEKRANGGAGSEVSASSPGESAAGVATKDDSGFHLPVALLGLFYFTALVVWYSLFGRTSGRTERRLVLVGCIVGASASAAFVLLMGLVIGAFCPLCMASHGVNFLLLFGVCLHYRSLRPRKSEASGENSPQPAFAALSLRSGALALVLLLMTWAAEGAVYRCAQLGSANRVLDDTLAAMQQDVDAIELVYFGQARQDVRVRDDSKSGLDALEFDAMIGAVDGYRNTVVVFGDVECGACRRFHEFLFDSVLPSHEGHLRVVYKHLPYDAGHPNARKAALALEAARRQGKFWEFLDLLYSEQDALRAFDYAGAIKRLDLDFASFVRDMSSPDVAARIAEDEALARELKVTATPAVFLNNRRVDKSLVRLPGFWNSQIERLKITRAEAGQAWGDSEASPEAVASSR